MKDAYYFSHDSNAKDDPKCVLLIDQLGPEGYGIFWILVETLRDQPNYKYPLRLIPALSKRYNTTAEKMKVVICNYELFVIEDETFFFSNSLIGRMKILEEKRKKKSIAGKIGNQIRWKIAKQSQCDNNAIASKVNKNKTKEILLFEEVKEEDKIDDLIPPIDGTERNFIGIRSRVNEFNISENEKISIIKLSNYGQIGNPVWAILSRIKESNRKIHSPLAFIESQLKK